MNQVTRFFVRRSSLLRQNPITRWSSSKPMSSFSSSSLISNNNNPSSSSNLLKRVFITNPYAPPPQIPGNHVRKLSGEAAAECKFDEDYLEEEIRKFIYQNLIYNVQSDIEGCEEGTLLPLEYSKILADEFDAFLERLGLDANEKDYPDHLMIFREDIEDLKYKADMVVAYGEYVAAGGSHDWHPFHGTWKMLMKGGKESREEHNQKILASLQQMKIRSNMMKRLMKEYELRQNQNLNNAHGGKDSKFV